MCDGSLLTEIWMQNTSLCVLRLGPTICITLVNIQTQIQHLNKNKRNEKLKRNRICSLLLWQKERTRLYTDTWTLRWVNPFSPTLFLIVTASPPLDNIRVVVIVWRLRGNIIRTALCWIVWHKMFTVRSTLIWAQVRQIGLGTLGPLRCE